MSIDTPKYDVAISFLFRDEAVASAINRKLSEGLEVFFFPRKQEDLAGTEGLESMRTPFFSDSRVMVVLYRDGWGKTPWTRVEETAIKESCLQYGWQRLFFVVLDRQATLPVWLPQTHVRFNYDDFGLEQAVGAVKARVQENGGQAHPLTALRRAELFKAEEEFRLRKARIDSDEGVRAIQGSVLRLFQQIEQGCTEISSRNLMSIRCGARFEERSSQSICSVTDDRVGLSVNWLQPYTNTLDRCALIVSEFRGGLMLPGEESCRMYVIQPNLLSETKYLPDLSRALEYGWNRIGTKEFLTSQALAEKCIIKFTDLAESETGKEIRGARGRVQY